MKRAASVYSDDILEQKRNKIKMQLLYSDKKEAKIKFIKSGLVSNENKTDVHVEYTFSISFMFSKWYLFKRYSDFNMLDQIIRNKIKSIKDGKPIYIPPLPPKRFFKNSESAIKEREIYLTKYLDYIMNNFELRNDKTVNQFLQIDPQLTELYLSKMNLLKDTEYSNEDKNKTNLEGENNLLFPNENKCYYSMLYTHLLKTKTNINEEKGINDLIIDEFLENVCEIKDNKTKVIKIFEKFFFDNLSCFKVKDIYYLLTQRDISEIKKKKEMSKKETKLIDEKNKINFINLFECGISNKDNSTLNETISSFGFNSKNILGSIALNQTKIKNKKRNFLEIFGSLRKNFLAAENCLDFILHLLNYEQNSDCDKILTVLKDNYMEIFDYMKIYEHITAKNNIYIKKLYMLISLILGNDYDNVVLSEIFHGDQEVIDEFLLYADADK
ncbi:MAG: hypothetical protein MJ252_09695 [archaeon]|nr:hypothetical protein [archaeon]